MITQRLRGGWKKPVMLGCSQDCCPTPTILFVWSHLLCNTLICEWFQFPHQNRRQESKKIEFFMVNINYSVFDRANWVLACMWPCCADQLNPRATLGSGNSKHSDPQAFCPNTNGYVFTIRAVHVKLFPMVHFLRMSIVGKLWKQAAPGLETLMCSHVLNTKEV